MSPRSISPRSRRASIQPYVTGLLLCAGLTVLVAILYVAGGEQIHLSISEMLIRMVVVVGMSIFIGNSGVLSFGHIGFMCIGAYAAAWAACDPAWKDIMLTGLPGFLREQQYPFSLAVIGSGVLAAVVGLLLGCVIIRLSGVAASIATFAFLVVVNSIYSNWDTVTAATSSVVGVPTVATPGVTLVFAILAIAAAAAFQHSRYGLMLRASRDDEVAAKASAVNIVKVRLVAFVLSACVVGVGGGLYAHLLGVLMVDAFFLPLTFITMAMLVVGGIGSLSGAVIGVVVVTVATEGLRMLEHGVDVGSVTFTVPHGTQEIGLGVFMSLILIFRPGGLMGREEVRWPRAWRPKVAPRISGESSAAAPRA